jgi:hypothetical protein
MTGILPPSLPLASANDIAAEDLMLLWDSSSLALKKVLFSVMRDKLAVLSPDWLASPAFTGVPTAPTASATNNSTQIATTAFVKAVVAALVASAPGTLDTLNELAAALGDDPNFAATLANALSAKAPLNSPGLTGVPTAPTADASTNTNQLATTAFVQTASAASGPVGYYAPELERPNPNYTSTKAFLNFENGLVDGVPGVTWTTIGNAVVVNHDAKFGEHALFIPDVNSGIILPNADGWLSPRLGDFFFSVWAKLSFPAEWGCCPGIGGWGASNCVVLLNGSTTSAVKIGSNEPNRVGGNPINSITYTCIEFSRTNGVARVFFNGEPKYVFADTTDINNTYPLSICPGVGYIDDIYYGLHGGNTSSYIPPEHNITNFAETYEKCSLQFKKGEAFNGVEALAWDATKGQLLIDGNIVVSGMGKGLILPDGGKLTGMANAVTAPSGGATVDTEGRAAITALITAFQNAGFMK